MAELVDATREFGTLLFTELDTSVVAILEVRILSSPQLLIKNSKVMAKQETKSVDCRNCKLSDKSKVGDHMIFCNKLELFRSWGLRNCQYFKP